MQYLAAYALVALSGKAPTKAAVQAVLKAAGVAGDSSRIDALFSELDGKNFDEVMAEGRTKLVGSGSAAPASSGAAAPAAGASAAAAAEAKKEEPEEEADDDMGFGLFD